MIPKLKGKDFKIIKSAPKYKISDDGEVQQRYNSRTVREFFISESGKPYVNLLTPYGEIKSFSIQELLADNWGFQIDPYTLGDYPVLDYDPTLERIDTIYKYNNVAIVLFEGKKRCMACNKTLDRLHKYKK